MAQAQGNSDTAMISNDLLYFVNYKRKISPVNDVVAICEKFYSPDVVLDAKRLFFDCVGERDGMRFVSRRGENPSRANLDDLVNTMNKCDNDGISFPTFVSSDYSRIPQNDDGSVSLSQILFMMVEMKRQMNKLESRVSNSSRNDAVTRDSSTHDNSQVDLFATQTMTSTSSNPDPAPALPPPPPPSLPPPSIIVNSVERDAGADGDGVGDSSGGGAGGGAGGGGAGVTPGSPAWNRVARRRGGDREGRSGKTGGNANGRPRNQSNQRKTAESRIHANFARNRNVVIGKKPSSGAMSWSGANLTVACYIGRVDLSVSKDLIKEDLKAMDVNVIDIDENETRHGLFKSFKLVVTKKDFDFLSSEEKWPEGVVFRRFRHPRRPPESGQVDDWSAK